MSSERVENISPTPFSTGKSGRAEREKMRLAMRIPNYIATSTIRHVCVDKRATCHDLHSVHYLSCTIAFQYAQRFEAMRGRLIRLVLRCPRSTCSTRQWSCHAASRGSRTGNSSELHKKQTRASKMSSGPAWLTFFMSWSTATPSSRRDRHPPLTGFNLEIPRIVDIQLLHNLLALCCVGKI